MYYTKYCDIDISPEMLAQAKKNLHNIPNVSLQLGSASKLPYADNSFDYVTCVISFHHHPNSEVSLCEMKRVAKPGGVVLIADGNTDGIVRKIFYKADQIINKEGKVYRYTKKEMYTLFKKSSFKNISQQIYRYFDLITIGEK